MVFGKIITANTLITAFCCLVIPTTSARINHLLSRRHAPQFISYSVLEHNARTKVTIVSGDGKTSFSIETDTYTPDAIRDGVQVVLASPAIFDKIPKFRCEGPDCPEGNRVPFDRPEDAARSRPKSCPTGFRLSSSNRFCTKCTPQPVETCPANCSKSNNKCLCCLTQPL